VLRANEPTIWLQLVGHDTSNNQATSASSSSSSSTARLAGELDPQHPLDILWAVPPDHYFEQIINEHGIQPQFQSRFFLDERGPHSVIGANILMGHDVLFDIDHRRLGVAASTCNYTALTAAYPVPPSTITPKHVSDHDDDDADHDPGENGGGAMAICSTHKCQYGVLLCVTLFVLCFVRRVACGRRVRYDPLAGNDETIGLEMKVDHGINNDGYRDDDEDDDDEDDFGDRNDRELT
jgi:hypothetical protein